MKPLRLATVPYINIEPFLRALCSLHPCDILRAAPSELVRVWKTTDLDLCLLSTADLLAHGEEALEGAAITSEGPVESVAIFSRRTPSAWHRVALDAASSTANRLARLLLERRLPLEPQFLVARDPEAALRAGRCHAALLIGDRALAHRRTPVWMDLGEAWMELSGLPFVYAAWARGRRSDFSRGALEDLLERARRRSSDFVETSVEQAAGMRGLSRRALRRYLRERISYRFGRNERLGMEFFGRLILPARTEEPMVPAVSCAGRLA